MEPVEVGRADDGPEQVQERFSRAIDIASRLLDNIETVVYGKREELTVPESDMFRAELDMFADSCRSGKANELSARNGNVALAVVYAGLRSIEKSGAAVKLADIIAEAHERVAKGSRHVA